MASSRPLQKVRVVRVPHLKVVKVGPVKRKGVRRRGALRGLGGGANLRTIGWAAAGAFIAGKVAKGAFLPGMGIPLAEALGSKKLAIGVLMFGAGHFARIPVLKLMAIGALSAAAFEYGFSGEMSGDEGEGDIE